MRHRPLYSIVLISLMLSGGVIACGQPSTPFVVIPSPPAVTEEESTEEAVDIPAETRIPEGSGDSHLFFPDDTQVTPPTEIGDIVVETLSETELPAEPPPEDNVITAVEITPNGMMFDPGAQLSFLLPDDHGFDAGDELNVLQYDSGTRVWQDAGEATVDQNREFANGHITHTSVFALTVELDVAGSLFDNIDEQILAGGPKQLGLMWNTSTDRSVMALVAEYFIENGVELLQTDLEPGATDVTPTILSMQAAGAEALIIANLDSDTSDLILVQAEELGWGGLIFGMDTSTGEVILLYPVVQ